MAEDNNIEKKPENKEETKIIEKENLPNSETKIEDNSKKESETSEEKNTEDKKPENENSQKKSEPARNASQSDAGEEKPEDESGGSKEDESKDSKEDKKPENKTPFEKKQETLVKKNTTPNTMKLVKEIKEVAKELKEINDEDIAETEVNSQEPEEAIEDNKEDESKDSKTEEKEVSEKPEDEPKGSKEDGSKDSKEEKSEKSEDSKDSEEKPKEENKPKGLEEKPEDEPKGSKEDSSEKQEDKKEDSKPPVSEEKPEKKSIFAKIFKKKQKKDSNVEKENNGKKKKKIGKLLLIILIPIILILAIAGLAFFTLKPIYDEGQKTMELGKQTLELIKTQDLIGTQAKLKETQVSLTILQSNYKKAGWLKILPVVSKYYQDGEAGLIAGGNGLEAGNILLEAIIPYADVLGFTGEGSFEGGTAEDRVVKMVETLDKIIPSLDQTSEKFKIISQELDKIDPNDYPEEFKGNQIRSKIIKAKSLFSDISVAFTDARPLVEMLPKILGYPDGKKYMILFQNDGELRPTGGFMSAFSIVQLDKGRVNPIKSDDIYGLDSKLKERPKAPDILNKYLNEKVWFLRNMNLSPDFKVSMTTFKKYYDTLDGEFPIDGIIAIDTKTLEEIVKIIGPIEIPGYGTFSTELDKRCNLSQIVCELEHIVDKPLATVASNRKKDILGPMMKTILDKATSGNKTQLAALLDLGFKLLEQKHILTYFVDEKAQAGAEAFNIAGRVREFDADYLEVNDANLGGAKSNFYINQEVTQNIEIKEDGTIQKKIEVSYHHTEPMDNCNLEAGELCLSGIQRNYFRIYVPKGSQLVEGIGSETEIKAGEDLDKTYFEGFFNLRPETKVKIIVTYTLPFKASDISSYKMLIQKQPGTKDVKQIIELEGQKQEFVLNKDITIELKK